MKLPEFSLNGTQYCLTPTLAGSCPWVQGIRNKTQYKLNFDQFCKLCASTRLVVEQLPGEIMHKYSVQMYDNVGSWSSIEKTYPAKYLFIHQGMVYEIVNSVVKLANERTYYGAGSMIIRPKC